MNNAVPNPTELQLLALLSVERTGRELARRYEAEMGVPISYGTLYSTLRRLNNAGLVTTTHSARGDRRAKLFVRNTVGSEVLENGRLHYRRISEFAAEPH